jgi:Mlc titration factor MtfA (ptsG expression regulator)
LQGLASAEEMAMLVTPEQNRKNRRRAVAVVALLAAACGVAGWFSPPALLLLALCPIVYWLLRRWCRRRLAAMRRPFPSSWEQILRSRVVFFEALDDAGQERFRQMVKVFLDEVRITGIRTEVDDVVRVLTAASAVIPVFGFHDWDYRRLGEVLVYPGSFGEQYQTHGGPDENTLGMVGLRHLAGVMILSKPALLEGFDNRSGRGQVGVHEFAHLVEEGEAEGGLPPEVPVEVVRAWIRYVAQELANPRRNRSYLNDYAYTNEHEFFAVLSEYFFKSPEILRDKEPKLYRMLREMFHQDPGSLLRSAAQRRRRVGRNSPCPCGSGRKYKDCCLLKPAAGVAEPGGAGQGPVNAGTVEGPP